MSDRNDEYMRLVRLNGQLMQALQEVRAQMLALSPLPEQPAYRIALRPDDRDADPRAFGVLMDDIVVNDVKCFRAEQMDVHSWWVACYLDNETMDRICWAVTARSRPNRIEWVTTEFPQAATYEHESKALA